MSGQKQSDEDKWPGVEEAYSFVLPSYQFMLSRYEAADTRLTALTTAATGIAGLVPILGKAVNPAIVFHGWFTVGMSLLAGAVTVGLVARTMGGVVLPNPNKIYDKQLRWTPWEFKKNAIAHAGENFDTNAASVRRKGTSALVVAALTVLAVAALSRWLSR